MTSNETNDSRQRILFRGTVTSKQFSSIQQALLPWWARAYVVAPCIVYVFIFAGKNLQTMLANPIEIIANLLTASFVLLVSWAMIAYGRKRAWRMNNEVHGEISGSLSDAGVEWNTAFTSTNYPWAKLIKMRESPQMILLFYSARCAFYFPRHFFSTEDEWQAARSMFAVALTREQPVAR